MDYLFSVIQMAEGSSSKWRSLCTNLLGGFSERPGHAPNTPAKQRGVGPKYPQIKHSATFFFFFGVTSEPSFNIVFSFALVVNNDPQYRQCLKEMSITKLSDGEVKGATLQENNISEVCKLSNACISVHILAS